MRVLCIFFKFLTHLSKESVLFILRYVSLQPLSSDTVKYLSGFSSAFAIYVINFIPEKRNEISTLPPFSSSCCNSNLMISGYSFKFAGFPPIRLTNRFFPNLLLDFSFCRKGKTSYHSDFLTLFVKYSTKASSMFEQ